MNYLENKKQEFQRKRIKISKSDTKTINIIKLKLRQKKRLKGFDESLKIKEERTEGTQDKRSRVNESTHYEILNNLNFEEVHIDS